MNYLIVVYSITNYLINMKKILLLVIAVIGINMAGYAQQAVWKTEGVDIISNFSMKDINNNTHALNTMTGQGAHVIIDFSATWCGPCWSYHSTHVLQKYHEQYGANGTDLQDGRVIFYEVDKSTNNLTTSSLGDWTAGVTHPICDDNVSANPVSNFMATGGSYGIPRVVVVCKDNTYYTVSTSMTTVPALRSYIESKCGVAPLSSSSIQDIGFEYDVYPNPAANNLTVDLKLDNAEQVSYSLVNTFGQTIVSNVSGLNQAGLSKINIDLGDVAAGMYMLNLKVGESNISHKVVVTK